MFAKIQKSWKISRASQYQLVVQIWPMGRGLGTQALHTSLAQIIDETTRSSYGLKRH